ncbi:MAG: ABC transporter ATP-binding protein [Christensenellales bacterium]
MIKINNLNKSFGKRDVLVNISAEFFGGHIYGLIGTNGCGKTTLMRCICGFIKADSGTINVLGKEIGKDCDFAPSTGIIIETPGFLPYYSGKKNLEILMKISGKATPERVKQVMDTVGLDSEDKKNVSQYSLGMRQRLGIAQALMEKPEILILDEPFNGLDEQSKQLIHRLLQQLKQEGKCIIIASHSRADIEAACDIWCRFKNGAMLIEEQ